MKTDETPIACDSVGDDRPSAPLALLQLTIERFPVESASNTEGEMA